MSAPDRALIFLVLAGVVGVGGYLLWQTMAAPEVTRPGTPLGQSLGIAAGILMLISAGHPALKRTEAVGVAKRRLQIFHMVVGSLAVGFALAHSGARLTRPPGLILLGAIGLLLSGLYGRLVSPERAGQTFGRGGAPFTPTTARDPRLAVLVQEKRAVLSALNPAKAESVATLHRLSDWGRHPRLAFKHFMLSARERRVQRANVASGWSMLGVSERLWRLVHLWLAGLVILGLIAHVVTTVFFSGYVAGDREITWWHLRK